MVAAYTSDNLCPTDVCEELVQDRTLVAIFDGKVQMLTRNFLSLTAQRRRANSLVPILSAFTEMVEEREGILSAEVVSAIELNDEQKKRIAFSGACEWFAILVSTMGQRMQKLKSK